MLKSFSISNFRGFKLLNLPDLSRINLIAGTNNIGKTSVLEALFIYAGERNLSLLLQVNALRGLGKFQGNLAELSDWLWRPLFNNFTLDHTIELEGVYANRAKKKLELSLVQSPTASVPIEASISTTAPSILYSLALRYIDEKRKEQILNMSIDQHGKIIYSPAPSTPSTPGHFIGARNAIEPAEEAEYFGKLELQNKSEAFVQALKFFEPRLNTIKTIASPNGTILHAEIGLNRLLPLNLMGDGMTRLCAILLRIADAKDGIVLIDEVENGIHYANMPKFWSLIAEAARAFNVQVIATTHSYECIMSAHQALKNQNLDDLHVYRLENIQNEIKVIVFHGEELSTVEKHSMEIR